MKYQEYLDSELWQRQRAKIIERDQTCVLCGKSNNFRVHHKSYSYDYGSEQELGQLVLLCDDCHKLFHENHKYCSKTHCFVRVARRELNTFEKPIPRRKRKQSKLKKPKKDSCYSNVKIVPRKRLAGCLIDTKGQPRIRKHFVSSEHFLDKFDGYQYFCKNKGKKPRSNDILVTPSQLGVLTYFIRRICL